MADLRSLIEMREANVRRYYPDVLANAKEFIALADIVEPELNALIHAIVNNTLNVFVYQLNEDGATRWEHMLHLHPALDDSLEDRRMAILAKIMSALPYTYRKLEELLAGLCGENGFQIVHDWNTYSIKILVNLGAKKQKEAVTTMSRFILPCNLTIAVDLLFNRHIDLERFDHEHMHIYSHDDLQGEVLT